MAPDKRGWIQSGAKNLASVEMKEWALVYFNGRNQARVQEIEDGIRIYKTQNDLHGEERQMIP